jgi:hypothetical protein
VNEKDGENEMKHSKGMIQAVVFAACGLVALSTQPIASACVAIDVFNDAHGCVAISLFGDAGGTYAGSLFGDTHGHAVAVGHFGDTTGEGVVIDCYEPPEKCPCPSFPPQPRPCSQ